MMDHMQKAASRVIHVEPVATVFNPPPPKTPESHGPDMRGNMELTKISEVNAHRIAQLEAELAETQKNVAASANSSRGVSYGLTNATTMFQATSDKL